MPDYGRYESSTYDTERGDRSGRANRARGFGDYDGDQDREFGRSRERSKASIFGGWADDDREDNRERSGFRTRGDRDRDNDRDRSRMTGRGRDYYGYDDYHEGLDIDETSQLIASNKVEGTPVYGRDGDRLGSIYNFMVDKTSGKVKYAVMGYGGFLGMGKHYFPLPWDILDFDVREGGYRVGMTERDLERAPSFGRDNEPKFNRDYDRQVSRYYGTR